MILEKAMKYCRNNFYILFFFFGMTQSCYFVDYFETSDQQSETDAATGPTGSVIGQTLGDKAGDKDDAALDAVYAAVSGVPPASIRPDPDMYARRLLLQYRQEGSTVAREIGSIEGFRLLLGGASEDFQKTPQKEFDATSLLASLSVAERICEGLVSPDERQFPGWESILPVSPNDWEANIRFLAQRFIGKPSTKIDESIISSLKEILDSNLTEGSTYTFASYIPVCATLALDAEALLL
ncbi:MAG: hypothetical protein AB8G05_21915 [Oligoflexales bacterium]